MDRELVERLMAAGVPDRKIALIHGVAWATLRTWLRRSRLNGAVYPDRLPLEMRRAAATRALLATLDGGARLSPADAAFTIADCPDVATMADVAWILIQRQLVHECKIRWLTDLLQPKASSDRLAA